MRGSLVSEPGAVINTNEMIGVRATPSGFQAYCSLGNVQVVHLGFFGDPGLASQVADLGAIKAALEGGLPLQARSEALVAVVHFSAKSALELQPESDVQGLTLNEPVSEGDWPEEVLCELRARPWSEVVECMAGNTAAREYVASPDLLNEAEVSCQPSQCGD